MRLSTQERESFITEKVKWHWKEAMELMGAMGVSITMRDLLEEAENEERAENIKDEINSLLVAKVSLHGKGNKHKRNKINKNLKKLQEQLLEAEKVNFQIERDSAFYRLLKKKEYKKLLMMRQIISILH